MKETVSIIVPVRNRASLIGRCLDSILAQTWRPLRVYVVDNNSTDKTAESVLEWVASRSVTERDPDFALTLLDEPKPGASAARNRGLKMVDTPHVIFFDSDDVMMPTLVEDAVAAIGDNDLVYWQADVVGLDGRTRRKPFHRHRLLMRQFYNAMLATQLFMAKTSLVRCVGGWEERAAVWNDWELGIRLALVNPKAVALPKMLSLIYSQRDSITGESFSDKQGEWENTLDLVEQDIHRSESDDKIRLFDMLDYRRAILAAHYRREGAYDAAAKLLEKAIDRPGRTRLQKTLLQTLYHYTVAGGRAAYYLWRR